MYATKTLQDAGCRMQDRNGLKVTEHYVLLDSVVE